MTRVFLGIGSNLAEPEQQLRQSLRGLNDLQHTRLLAHSRLYFSKPLGPADQPDYVNACALIDTEMSPLALLDACQALENHHGRVRLRRWGERTLDIDLLLYGDQQWQHPRLTLPHPEMTNRDFVLLPLQELCPDLQLLDKPLTHWLGQCPSFVYHSLELD